MNVPFLINTLLILLSVLYWGVVFTIIYHLLRFGIGTMPKRMAAAFLLGSVILYCGALLSYHQVDLQALSALI